MESWICLLDLQIMMIIVCSQQYLHRFEAANRRSCMDTLCLNDLFRKLAIGAFELRVLIDVNALIIAQRQSVCLVFLWKRGG